MRTAIFSCRAFERPFLEAANGEAGHDLLLLEAALSERTVGLAEGCGAVGLFVGDDASAGTLKKLAGMGVKLLALRSAGFNHVDIRAAYDLGMTVLRVPAYSPYSVGEHAVGLMMTLNRKFHRAFNRTREQNFSLEGLMGFDMHGKTVGIVGTGKIGEVVCSIVRGFGCRVLAFDIERNPACEKLGATYVELDELLRSSDIITLHCPLNPKTHHLIDERALGLMREGAMLINTSRGGVIDTKALIGALKKGRLGSVGLDVYEEEGDLFFRDLSSTAIQDDVFVRLLTFPNVLITAHQGFFTREACEGIARTTIENLTGFEKGRPPEDNRVTLDHIAGK